MRADFLLEHHLLADGTSVRASLDGVVSRPPATLEDTGMLAGGLLELAVATGRRRATRSTARAAHRPRGRRGGRATAGAAVPFAAPGGGDPVLVARGLALPDGPGRGRDARRASRPARMPRGGCSRSAPAPRYRDVAEEAMRAVAGIALERPIAFGGTLG